MDSANSIYVMQRANGDWFAQERREGLRVPLFSSNSDAMQARSFNVEMLLFQPVLLDEQALKGFGLGEAEQTSHFWLVTQGSTNMKRGASLKLAELTRLVQRA